jgi:hypothetical protein
VWTRDPYNAASPLSLEGASLVTRILSRSGVAAQQLKHEVAPNMLSSTNQFDTHTVYGSNTRRAGRADGEYADFSGIDVIPVSLSKSPGLPGLIRRE